jgi:hypothetical protein
VCFREKFYLTFNNAGGLSRGGHILVKRIARGWLQAGEQDLPFIRYNPELRYFAPTHADIFWLATPREGAAKYERRK